VNGAAAKIEIIKPFEEAIEVAKKILFQPFDLGKWFVIGFAAWLAHLGGGGFNYHYRTKSDWNNNPMFQGVIERFSQIPWSVLISGLIALFVFILAVGIVFAWLRARGQFMFIDCVVKNRAAIAEPWREFREQGNSYFLFSLVVGLCIFIMVALMSLPFFIPIMKGMKLQQPDFYFICVIVIWALVFVAILFAWTVISHFMLPVMYRRRCLAREGFRVAVGLVADYPGEITLYCLFWIALSIGVALMTCAVTLATCCIALLPYIGTVILLPIFVFKRSFGLLFIRQFGPDYDVWASINQAPLPPPPIQPPPLPG
jgi:hypothetical protein